MSVIVAGCSSPPTAPPGREHTEAARMTFASAALRDPQGSWESRKFRQTVKQQFDYSCGAASLLTLLRYSFGLKALPDEPELVESMHSRLYGPAEERPEEIGFSLLDLKEASSWFGLRATGVRLPLETMVDLRVPAIVHLKLWGEVEHFAVWQGADHGQVTLADPNRGRIDIPLWQFELEWTGYALLVARPGDHPPELSPAGIKAGTLLRTEDLVTWMNSVTLPPPPSRIPPDL